MNKLKNKSYPSESQIQSAFFNLLSLQVPWIRQYAFSIPNGGSRHKLEAIKLVKEGMTKGVPDVAICYPSKGYHGLFIEFKSKAGVLSKEQNGMIERLSKVGYLCHVCRDFEEAVFLVKEYVK